jgi:hypothetical protein
LIFPSSSRFGIPSSSRRLIFPSSSFFVGIPSSEFSLVCLCFSGALGRKDAYSVFLNGGIYGGLFSTSARRCRLVSAHPSGDGHAVVLAAVLVFEGVHVGHPRAWLDALDASPFFDDARNRRRCTLRLLSSARWGFYFLTQSGPEALRINLCNTVRKQYTLYHLDLSVKISSR